MANTPKKTTGEEIKQQEATEAEVNNAQMPSAQEVQPQETKTHTREMVKGLMREMSREEFARRSRLALVAILVLGSISPVVNSVRLWDVHSEIEKRNQNVNKNGPNGSWLCNVPENDISSLEIKNYEICGKKFKADKEIGDFAVRVDQQMREDYERYKTGKMGALEKTLYWEYVKKSGGEKNVKCLQVNYGLRSNVEQYLIFLDSLNEEGKNAWRAGLPIDREKHQTFRAAEPCHSEHEKGRAIDVNNWGAAEPYFWKLGIPGGAHGLYKDPWHFSKGEFKRGNMLDAGKQWAWWGYCQKLKACSRHK